MSCTFVIPPSTGPKALRDLSTAFMSEKNPFEKKEGWRSAVALVLGMSECRKQELMKMEAHEVSQLLYRDNIYVKYHDVKSVLPLADVLPNMVKSNPSLKPKPPTSWGVVALLKQALEVGCISGDDMR